MAVLVGAGLGYWVDLRWESTPIGVISGVVIGFAAMVVRLLRLGRELVPESVPESTPKSTQPGPSTGAAADDDDAGGSGDEDLGPAETPGLIDIWRDDARDERD